MVKLGILIGSKGRGSNMLAIAKACSAKEIDATVQVVISPKPDSQAVLSAKELGLTVQVVSSSNENYSQDLLTSLEGCDLICLAGFMRLLPAEVLHEFPNRILNIHPALLPKFGGKGMYGHHVHEAVLAARETETGCTVHFVSENYDEGEIILQKKCPVMPGETAESLAARVLEQEHFAYSEAIQKVIEAL